MTRSIARLRRILALTERLYEERARAAASSKLARDELAQAVSATRDYLDGEEVGAAVFTDMAIARAGKLARKLEAAEGEFEALVAEAVEARAGVKGMSGMLDRAVLGHARAGEARVLEELLDRVAQRKVSLR
jgi:hypothetical protein